MRLVTFTTEGRGRQIGELVDDKIYISTWRDSMRSLIQRGITPSLGTETATLDEVTLQPPLRPGKIIAIGRNYAEHAQELGNEVDQAPLIFSKLTTSLIGDGGVITWRESITQQVDWEGELAVIVGKYARDVEEKHALDYVFGYSIANDVSARDIQFSESQWIRAKGLDTFCPMGPCIVTRDSIDDPQALNIKTTVNDETMQDASTGDMVFNVAQLIAYCSRMFTLEPGDVIMTGTPSGVGKGMDPPRFLNDGDKVTVSIDGIGELTNSCRVLS